MPAADQAVVNTNRSGRLLSTGTYNFSRFFPDDPNAFHRKQKNRDQFFRTFGLGIPMSVLRIEGCSHVNQCRQTLLS